MIRVQIDKASVHSLSGTVVEGGEKVSVPTKQRVFPPELVEA